MYRKNKSHLQPPLLSNISQLPEKHRKRLEQSWASVFYREVFSRIDEDIFSVLYTDVPSRPNIAVNVLVGLEFMKAGFGWSDEELYDAFTYNLQVRYALGYHEFGEGDFDLRTLYYFRERLNRHMQAQGENLLEKAFEQVTDEQVTAFRLKTGIQRMDTTLVSSNIREWGRMQLLVAVLQRVQRMLSAKDQASYAEVFAPYLTGHAGNYAYRLKKGDFFLHLQRIGDLMYRLLTELKTAYQEQPTYQMLERVFQEQYRVENQRVKGLYDHELSPQRLLSPDDCEATLRGRRNAIYQGYTANLTETCDPDNPLQLILKSQMASNNVDDPQLLLAALPNLKERTELEKLITDGGYGSFEVDQAMQENQVEQVPTGIRGRRPNPEKLRQADFEVQFSETGDPMQVKCPQGQIVALVRGNQQKGYMAHFDSLVCSNCPFGQTAQCPTKPKRRHLSRSLHFTKQEIWVNKRRWRVKTVSKKEHNLRAAIEATCWAIKCRFPAGKFPVRGLFRMWSMLIGSSAMNNVRRINRYLLAT